MNAPRFVAIEDYAAQLVAALVVDGAVLDDRFIVRHATKGFCETFGVGGPIDMSFSACLGDTNEHSIASLTKRLANAPFSPPQSETFSEDAPTGGAEFLPFPISGEAAPIAPQVELWLSRPHMQVRLSPLFAPGGLRYGYLVQELPNKRPLLGATLPLQTVDLEARPEIYHLLERLSHGYWSHDLRTNERQFSAAWCKLRGLTQHDIATETEVEWKARLHPDDLAAALRFHERLYAGVGDFQPIIFRERHADGHWLTVLVQSAVLERGPKGEPLLVVGTDVDISASYSTEEYTRQVASLEQRWLIASEYGKLGLWDNDILKTARYVSQTWRQMRGYGPEDELDESLAAMIERVHPDDRRALNDQVERTTRGDTDAVYQEYRERHRNGHYIWILARGRVISRDADGHAARIIGIDTDITEIKSSSEEILAMSRRLELAVSASRVGVWEVDMETGMAQWDPRMMEIYGLDQTTPDVPAEVWEHTIHPEDRDRVMQRAGAVDRGEGPFWGQYRIVRPDGSIRYIRARSSEVYDVNGRSNLIGVDWDVTADVEAAEELRRAHALARRRNEELEQARAEMEHNALHDALTGLPNRRHLDNVMQMVRSSSREIAILQMDLDRFKQINDTLGHAAGDTVLRHVSDVIKKCAPPGATIARVGGDEFIILLADATPRNVLVTISNNIVAALHVPLNINGQDCRFGTSIGIATGHLSDVTPEVVMENSDMALYEAKSAGRSRSTFFADRMRIAVEAKRLLADAILGGLERDEFFCVYQPQFQAKTLQISGVEALVRWQRIDGSIAAPAEFLSVAEELNVVDRLDQVVLTQVLHDQANWQAMGIDVPRVSVNVSARRLADQGLPKMLRSLCIVPGRIAFELLETVFLDTPDPAIAANIAAIRDMGIEIEIDDFGTGHASIVGMLRLQPDRLKIDQQLVGPLVEGEKQGQLVRSIIDIGNMHGIALIAEGVETAEHVRLLTAMGCHDLQGYGLGMPMPETELRERLRTGLWEMSAA